MFIVSWEVRLNLELPNSRPLWSLRMNMESWQLLSKTDLSSQLAMFQSAVFPTLASYVLPLNAAIEAIRS